MLLGPKWIVRTSFERVTTLNTAQLEKHRYYFEHSQQNKAETTEKKQQQQQKQQQ